MSKPIKLVEVYSIHTAKDKYVIRRDRPTGFSYDVDIILAVLVAVTQDFDPNDKIDWILGETDSYQIRPKALYKSTRGLFYKDGSERRYLDNQEIIDFKIDNPELGKFL